MDGGEDGAVHGTGHRDLGEPEVDGADVAHNLGSDLGELEIQIQAHLRSVGDDFKQYNATGQPLTSVSQKTPRQILTIQTFQIQ